MGMILLGIGTLVPLLSVSTENIFNTVEEAAKVISGGKCIEKHVR